MWIKQNPTVSSPPGSFKAFILSQFLSVLLANLQINLQTPRYSITIELINTFTILCYMKFPQSSTGTLKQTSDENAQHLVKQSLEDLWKQYGCKNNVFKLLFSPFSSCLSPPVTFSVMIYLSARTLHLAFLRKDCSLHCL